MQPKLSHCRLFAFAPSRIVVAALLLALFPAAFANESLTVGGLTAARDSIRSGFIVVPGGPDGDPGTRIPVTLYNGAGDGPVLTLMAGTHGSEYAPIIAMQRLPQLLSTSEMSGALILVHIANLPSFTARTIYVGPQDLKNLNRAYPGNADGTLTERLADVITREILDRSDYYIDIHAGDANEALRPSYSAYYREAGGERVVAESRRLAVAFGLDTIVEFGGDLGDASSRIYTGAQAVHRGVPSIDIESGGEGSTEDRFVDPIVDGSLSVMRELGMISGEPSPRPEPRFIADRARVYSDVDGIWYPDSLVAAGDFVTRGQRLGHITDYFGNVVQEVSAPANGVLLILFSTPPVNRGDNIVVIGRVDGP